MTYLVEIEDKNATNVPPDVLYTLNIEATDGIHAVEQALERINDGECIGTVRLAISEASLRAVCDDG